jgi:hypothetical protein
MISHLYRTRIDVDLVVNNGAAWVKVISRSARGLAMEYVGAGGGTSRTIVEQAQDYLQVSGLESHRGRMGVADE